MKRNLQNKGVVVDLKQGLGFFVPFYYRGRQVLIEVGPLAN